MSLGTHPALINTSIGGFISLERVLRAARAPNNCSWRLLLCKAVIKQMVILMTINYMS